MKEKLYTIPLNDAMNENDECPFCFLERALFQKTMDFVLGDSSSYMESDMRDKTDKAGFCRAHTKMMFDYGNSLGNGLILQTHLAKVQEELRQQMKAYTPSGKGGHTGIGCHALLQRIFPTHGSNQCFLHLLHW